MGTGRGSDRQTEHMGITGIRQREVSGGRREPYPPGSCPGWGMSWWLRERNLLDCWPDLTMQERADQMFGDHGYWAAVRDGWWPDVRGEEYVDSYHPFKPDDRHARAGYAFKRLLR
jgi:hypothetical protein